MTAFRNAYLYLSLLALAVIVGFWPSYFSVIQSVSTGPHVHGVLMMLWIAMLISQAYLIRSDNRSLHRAIGTSSYVLAPIIFWSGLAVAQDALLRGPGIATMEEAQVMALPLAPISGFALSWGLAIYYRKNRQLHARFMMSTGLIVSQAALLRVFLFFVPGFGNNDMAVHGAYVPLELVVVALVVGDRKNGFPRSPWLVALGVLVFSHALYFAVEGSTGWHQFVEWFGGVPLFQPWERSGVATLPIV